MALSQGHTISALPCGVGLGGLNPVDYKRGFMSKRFTLELELPDDVAATLGAAEVAGKAREAFVMELLREHRVSQGKAAELLQVSRADFFPLMTRYQIPVADFTPEELREELQQPFPEP